MDRQFNKRIKYSIINLNSLRFKFRISTPSNFILPEFGSYNRRINFAIVDFPLPDTPVTQVKVPIGIFKLTFCKLFPLAPKISKNLPFFASLLFFGIGI